MVLPHTAFARLFTRALVFNGRSSRSEFWWGQTMLGSVAVAAVYILVLSMPVSILDAGATPLTDSAMVMTLLGLSAGLTLINFTAQARRLHDAGYSSLWMLVSFVPLIGALVLLVLYVMPSENGSNKWGAGPDGPMGFDDRPLREGGEAELSPTPAAPRKVKAKGKAGRKPSAWDSYAILANGDADAPPPPQVVEARKAEISDYYRRNVLKQADIPAE
ncbi:DUF805 domain-containing protein [Sagittula sp. S175]|uniref:DUF805 domain-containing protein n=1 Tax=Sagittula sp. S175 TaxID=3415129 RepID=UPI003C7CE717